MGMMHPLPQCHLNEHAHGRAHLLCSHARKKRYFNGGTAPWLDASPEGAAPPKCTWSTELSDTYLAGLTSETKFYSSLDAAKAACSAAEDCGGITSNTGPSHAKWQQRASSKAAKSPDGEASYAITNSAECHPAPPIPAVDPLWKLRGAAAYAGLTRTDPEAIWSFQGWAFIGQLYSPFSHPSRFPRPACSKVCKKHVIRK